LAIRMRWPFVGATDADAGAFVAFRIEHITLATWIALLSTIPTRTAVALSRSNG